MHRGKYTTEQGHAMNVITRQGYHFEDLELGMEASFAKTVSAADVLSFAEVTGDRNPVHLDAAYAAKTIFKEPIAHGMLTAGYISAVFGMLALNGLPMPYHPVFNVARFAMASKDRFFLIVFSSDKKYDAVTTRQFLEGLHPKTLTEVPD